MRIKQGQGYRIPTVVQQRNVDGTFTDVDPTTILGTLLLPDQTTQSFTPTKDSVGHYHADLSPTLLAAQTGPYQWKVITTGPGAGEQDGSFDVVDPFATELLSLDDAKAHLQLTGVTSARTLTDDELELYIAVATEAIEDYVGPVGRQAARTDVIAPSGGVLLVRTPPMLALTSVTPYASAPLTVGLLDVRLSEGLIYPGTYALFSASSYSVVYPVGRSAVLASMNMAARMVVQHLAGTQRGAAEASFSTFQGGDTGDVTGQAFAFVKSLGVRELLDPYRSRARVRTP